MLLVGRQPQPEQVERTAHKQEGERAAHVETVAGAEPRCSQGDSCACTLQVLCQLSYTGKLACAHRRWGALRRSRWLALNLRQGQTDERPESSGGRHALMGRRRAALYHIAQDRQGTVLLDEDHVFIRVVLVCR